MKWILSLLFVISVTAHAADKEAPTSEAAPAAVSAEANDVETAAAAPTEETAKEAVASKDLPKVDNRKESEIPLNLEKQKSASSDGSGMFRILLTLSILGLVGSGAFFFLRKYSRPTERKHQTQIKILQQHYLGPKKSLAIVRVAGESILIGVTDHNISMIKSLSLLDDEVPEEAPKSFGKVMGSFDEDEAETQQEPAARVSFNTRSKETPKNLDADEEFAISGIKDIVSKRLKGMRNFQ